MYSCQPQVVETINARTGGTITHSVPTFYLHPDVQGIISVEHAETIVVGICNPTKDATLVVHPNVTLVILD
jgi:hypothetical protein